MTRRLWLGVLVTVCVGASIGAIALGAWAFALAAIASAVVGALIIDKVPGNRVGPVLLVLGMAAAVSDLAVAYLEAGVESGTGLDRTMAVLAASVFPLMALAIAALALVFPTGEPRGRWKWVLVGLVLVGALGASGGAIWAGTRPLDYVIETITAAVDSAQPAEVASALVFMIGIPLSLVSLIARYLSARVTERLQIRWLMLAVTIAFGVTAIVNVLGAFDSMVGIAAGSIALAAIPISVGVAVSRYRLYDIDRIVSRTVAYGLVLTLLALVFVSIAVVPTIALGSEDAPPWLIAASTLTVFALFNPLRLRMQHVVDRRFNRLAYDPDRVAGSLAQALRQEMHVPSVASAWQGAVRTALEPTASSVWVRGTDA